MQINQDAANEGARGVRKYVGPVTVAVQELDGWFSYNMAVETVRSKHDITCHSKSRRNKKKKIPLCTNEEVDMDLSAMDDSPVLWIRVDPDMQLVRSLDILQPDFQWQYQLRHERDITAQLEAVAALERFPTAGSKKALVDMIEEEKCFYKVRCAACHSLTKVIFALGYFYLLCQIGLLFILGFQCHVFVIRRSPCPFGHFQKDVWLLCQFKYLQTK